MRAAGESGRADVRVHSLQRVVSGAVSSTSTAAYTEATRTGAHDNGVDGFGALDVDQ